MLRFVVWILLLAAVVYAMFWIIDRRTRSGPGPGRGGGSRPVRPSGPKGPDDDEDFLRDLDWQRRRAARRPRSGPEPGNGPGSRPDHGPGDGPGSRPDHEPDNGSGEGPSPSSAERDPSEADDSTEPPHK